MKIGCFVLLKTDNNVGNFCAILHSENPEAVLLKGSAKYIYYFQTSKKVAKKSSPTSASCLTHNPAFTHNPGSTEKLSQFFIVKIFKNFLITIYLEKHFF